MYILDSKGKSVPASIIADNLQQRFREYERKKRNAFRKSIERACSILYEEEGIGGSPDTKKYKKRKKSDKWEDGSDSDSFSSDIEEYVDCKDTNSMNSMMASMYRKTPHSEKSSGRSNKDNSTPGSPHRTDIGSQGPSLGRSLFVIDKSGEKNIDSKSRKHKTPNSKANGKDFPGDGKRKNEKNSNDVIVLSEENNEKKSRHYFFEDSIASSPMSVDVLDVDPSAEESKEVKTPSAGSKKGIKKLKKTTEKTEKKKRALEVQQSAITFADIGGNEKTIEEVCKLLVHMKHPEVYRQLGVTPPRGFLLHGPPGCGKTLLAHAIAGELQLPFIKLAATEIVSGVSGESEEKVRDIFEQAVSTSPCILFMDEIDAITQKRENASKDMERRIVAQLLTCMDELNAKPEVQVIVIGATNREDSLDPALRRAGRFDREICMGIPNEKARRSILNVLCRGLRLHENFNFPQLARLTPGFVGADLMALAREAAMTAVNRVLCHAQAGALSEDRKGSQSKSSTKASESLGSKHTETVMDIEPIDLDKSNDSVVVLDKPSDIVVTKSCSGDMRKVMISHDAGISPPKPDETENNDTHLSSSIVSVLDWLKDTPPLTEEQMADLYITMDDFTHACKVVQPSAKREGFATIPDVTWNDIGALSNVREELDMAILAPVRHPEQFEALGMTSPAGVLLAGPPGCGKTLLAKAVANESGLNFISVKGPELLNMYVGESERAVRQVFTRARNSAPCVIFFDELDALCPKRSGSAEGNSSARVVNQLLTEMDGLEERKQVFIMGATNRPDIVDPAVLRPGRLDKIIYVGLPGREDRWDILKTLTKNGTKPALADDVKLQEISEQPECQCYTGADLAALVRESSVIALKEFMSQPSRDVTAKVHVHRKHFDLALKKIKPSVSSKDQDKYMKMKEQFTAQ